MSAKDCILTLPKNKLFSKNEIRDLIHEEIPSYSEAALSWLLRELTKQGFLQNISKGIYQICAQDSARSDYSYMHSEIYKSVETLIAKEYPLVDFQMWELYQMNEFLNHLLGKNTIFVDVEPDCTDFVFETLHDTFSDVLYCPTSEQYHRQRGADVTIIVEKLISESPRPYEEHSAPLEKILVDLFSRKLTGKLLPRSEYPVIFEDCFQRFRIDEAKMLRYARRRNIENDIREFITKETTVHLHV